MKRKNTITALLICASALSIVSCSNGQAAEPSSSSEIQSSNIIEDTSADMTEAANDVTEKIEVTALPDTDDDGNKITVIEVTEKDGVAVTDAEKNPVTELAVVDKSGSIITNAEGSAVKPNISKTTTKAADVSEAKQTASEPQGSENENGSNIANSDTKYAGMLWLAGYRSENNNVIFDYIKQDGKLIEITIKVNENAKDGNYTISCAQSTPGGQESNFVDEDSQSLNNKYYPATIAVNGTAPENEIPSDGVVFWLSNASAAPGETITIYGSISNLKTSLAAFNTYLEYDPSVFTVESITACDLIKGNGEFLANTK